MSRHKSTFRVVLCGHKAAEVSAVCIVLMVQGHLLDVTLAHVVIAAKTGLIAMVPALGLTFTRYARHFTNRWTASLFLGLCGFLADSVVHGSHYPGAYTEAALTGLGACALSIAVSYTPLGKRMDALAEAFGDERSAVDVPEVSTARPPKST